MGISHRAVVSAHSYYSACHVSRGPTAPLYLLLSPKKNKLSAHRSKGQTCELFKEMLALSRGECTKSVNIYHPVKCQTRLFRPLTWILKQTQARGLLINDPKGSHMYPEEHGSGYSHISSWLSPWRYSKNPLHFHLTIQQLRIIKSRSN